MLGEKEMERRPGPRKERVFLWPFQGIHWGRRAAFPQAAAPTSPSLKVRKYPQQRAWLPLSPASTPVTLQGGQRGRRAAGTAGRAPAPYLPLLLLPSLLLGSQATRAGAGRAAKGLSQQDTRTGQGQPMPAQPAPPEHKNIHWLASGEGEGLGAPLGVRSQERTGDKVLPTG